MIFLHSSKSNVRSKFVDIILQHESNQHEYLLLNLLFDIPSDEVNIKKHLGNKQNYMDKLKCKCFT